MHGNGRPDQLCEHQDRLLLPKVHNGATVKTRNTAAGTGLKAFRSKRTHHAGVQGTFSLTNPASPEIRVFTTPMTGVAQRGQGHLNPGGPASTLNAGTVLARTGLSVPAIPVLSVVPLDRWNAEVFLSELTSRPMMRLTQAHGADDARRIRKPGRIGAGHH